MAENDLCVTLVFKDVEWAWALGWAGWRYWHAEEDKTGMHRWLTGTGMHRWFTGTGMQRRIRLACIGGSQVLACRGG